MIAIRDLTKTYVTRFDRIEALRGVSLDIRKGEVFGIVGFSGAGKSTLIRCMNRLEEPNSGSVVIAGRQITGMDEKELTRARRKIGMIFQHFNLFDSRTVLQNVAFPLEVTGCPKGMIAERAMRLIELVGLSDKIRAYPGQLSGGQKQRVGIARALANEPHVLLCDEATSALDPQTTYSTLELLANLNRSLGLTIVLITHELDVVRSICGRLAVIEAGRIVETGTVEEVFRNPRSDTARRFVGISRFFQDRSLLQEGAGI